MLGLIKDNKNPKKIVFQDVVYNFDGKNYIDKKDYFIPSEINETDMFDKTIYLLPDE